MELEKSQTWKNLESALSQEAVAYCEYTFYGQQAAKDGYKQISDIFNETADNELHHAKLHYKKMHGGKVPGTLDNLKAAAASEDEEVGIYTDYAKTAREEGFADLERNPHVAQHGENQCSDCHKAHRASVNMCSQCHNDAPIPEGWISAADNTALEKELDSLNKA